MIKWYALDEKEWGPDFYRSRNGKFLVEKIDGKGWMASVYYRRANLEFEDEIRGLASLEDAKEWCDRY